MLSLGSLLIVTVSKHAFKYSQHIPGTVAAAVSANLISIITSLHLYNLHPHLWTLWTKYGSYKITKEPSPVKTN